MITLSCCANSLGGMVVVMVVVVALGALQEASGVGIAVPYAAQGNGAGRWMPGAASTEPSQRG